MRNYTVFIGPGRSGTSYIDNVLRGDHRLCLPKATKETNFFLQYSGEEKYGNFFSNGDRPRVEVANMYIYSEQAALNLLSLPDNTNLVAVLRDPYERLLSAIRYRVSSGEIRYLPSVDEYVSEHPDLIDQSSYYALLKPYFNLFHDRLRILFFRDLSRISSRHTLCQ